MITCCLTDDLNLRKLSTLFWWRPGLKNVEMPMNFPVKKTGSGGKCGLIVVLIIGKKCRNADELSYKKQGVGLTRVEG